MYLKVNRSVKRLHKSDIGVTRSGLWSPLLIGAVFITMMYLWSYFQYSERKYCNHLMLLWRNLQKRLSFFIDSYSSCKSNCATYLNPSRRIILTTTCLNCDGINQINYNWSAEDVETSAPFSIWPDRALTPRDSQNAVILGNTFDSGASYKIRVMASRSNSG